MTYHTFLSTENIEDYVALLEQQISNCTQFSAHLNADRHTDDLVFISRLDYSLCVELAQSIFHRKAYAPCIRTIGGTSRATFRIPAKRLNITIYPVLNNRWFWNCYS